MTISQIRRWGQMTGPETGALDRERTVLVLPVGATEQHGPHLPLDTDTRIAEAVVEAALTRLAADVPAVVLPAQAVGWSAEHANFAGTLSAEPDLLANLWGGIVRPLARQGFKKLLILNGHGGQPEVSEIVCRRLRMEEGMCAVPLNWFGFGLPEGVLPPQEMKLGIHGGAVETSLLLHLAPELVRQGEVRDFPSRTAALKAEGWQHFSPQGPAGFAWAAEDLNPEGVTGDARLASADIGRAILDHAAAGLAGLIGELSRAPWPLPPAG
ncbi:creatininase family protein [Radicibacter daui]|uniref:creatininase family protein n=1 Tax=Radicibacter daui TaxID=3064829 RepID=UPI004046B946